jgi:hypothetical protein
VVTSLHHQDLGFLWPGFFVALKKFYWGLTVLGLLADCRVSNLGDTHMTQNELATAGNQEVTARDVAQFHHNAKIPAWARFVEVWPYSSDKYWARYTGNDGIYRWLHPTENRWVEEPDQVGMPLFPSEIDAWRGVFKSPQPPSMGTGNFHREATPANQSPKITPIVHEVEEFMRLVRYPSLRHETKINDLPKLHIFYRAILELIASGRGADTAKRQAFYEKKPDAADDAKQKAFIDNLALRVVNRLGDPNGAKTFADTKINHRFMHGLLGLTTEVTEIWEETLLAILEDRDVNLDNLQEEMGDLEWYQALMRDWAEGADGNRNRFTQWAIQNANHAKLDQRYGNGKTTGAARDVAAERAAMDATSVPQKAGVADDNDGVAVEADGSQAPSAQEVCGFVPPTPGYAPCTRQKGHEGPCAHAPFDDDPLSSADGKLLS